MRQPHFSPSSLSSLSVFFFFLLLVRKETTRACTFSCPHSRVTLHTHSPAFISASSHPETRWNRMSPTREKKSKEADLVGLLRDRAQDPSTAVHPCLVQGQQSACAGYGCVHDEVVATMLRECSKETVGREARACMRRLEFVLHQSRPNFTSLNHRNSSVCAWQEHEHTHAHINGQAEKVMPSILSLPLYFQENKPSHAALISSKLSDLDALLRKGGAPEVQSTIHPSAAAAHPASGSAGGLPVVAHTHQQPKQQPRKRGEGSAPSAAAARGGGGGTWTTAACCAVQHSEAHSIKQCDVGPCSRCATRTSWKKERVRPWKRVRGQGLVAWCLPWIAVGQ